MGALYWRRISAAIPVTAIIPGTGGITCIALIILHQAIITQPVYRLLPSAGRFSESTRYYYENILS